VYIPEHFRETRIEVLREFIGQHALGTLVAVTAEGISANHIPMQLLPASDAGLGVLRGHIARANSLWRLLPAESAVLAIFHRPGSLRVPVLVPEQA
jgi:transcriptional regulator